MLEPNDHTPGFRKESPAPWEKPPGLGPGLGCQWEGALGGLGNPSRARPEREVADSRDAEEERVDFQWPCFLAGEGGRGITPSTQVSDLEGGGPTKSPGNCASSVFLQRGEDPE